MNQLETMRAEEAERESTMRRADEEMVKLRPTVMAYRDAVDRHQRATEPTKTIKRYQQLYDERARAAYGLNALRERIAEQEQAAKRMLHEVDWLDREIAKLSARDCHGNERIQIRRDEELKNCEHRRAGFLAALERIGTPRDAAVVVIEEAI